MGAHTLTGLPLLNKSVMIFPLSIIILLWISVINSATHNPVILQLIAQVKY